MEINPMLVTWTSHILADRRRLILKKIAECKPELKGQIRSFSKKYELEPKAQPIQYKL
jgi:hypothetical protein